MRFLNTVFITPSFLFFIFIICQWLIAFFNTIFFPLPFRPNVSPHSLQFNFSSTALGCEESRTTAWGLVCKYF